MDHEAAGVRQGDVGELLLGDDVLRPLSGFFIAIPPAVAAGAAGGVTVLATIVRRAGVAVKGRD